MNRLSYQWRVLQEGSLPLRPDDSMRLGVEHVCTSVLVWPEGEPPRPDNTVMTDPCFSRRGFRAVEPALAELGLTIADVGRCFVTHQHGDHRPYGPWPARLEHLEPFEPDGQGRLSGIEAVACPGHSPDLRALAFRSGAERVWVVGDAVLDEEWLRAWRYYWPNDYTPAEVEQTWRSLARIVAEADRIVPGHGPPFRVDAELLDDLVAAYPLAERGHLCPDVLETLTARRHEFG